MSLQCENVLTLQKCPLSVKMSSLFKKGPHSVKMWKIVIVFFRNIISLFQKSHQLEQISLFSEILFTLQKYSCSQGLKINLVLTQTKIELHTYTHNDIICHSHTHTDFHTKTQVLSFPSDTHTENESVLCACKVEQCWLSALTESTLKTQIRGRNDPPVETYPHEHSKKNIYTHSMWTLEYKTQCFRWEQCSWRE